MRAIALDVGERRIGMAAGDTESRVAVPVGAIDRERTADVNQRIVEMARERDAAVIVVGLPLSMSGRRGPQADATLAFVEDLKRCTDLAIEVVDERLSSVEAERRIRESAPRGRGRTPRPEKGAIDAGAAVLILQTWLDRR
jgi:putative Holliday junction resolvase